MKLCSFLSSLYWPSSVGDLGVGGVSFVELLIFSSGGQERGWFGRCRFLSCVCLVVLFQCRLLLRERALKFGDPAGFWVR